MNQRYGSKSILKDQTIPLGSKYAQHFSQVLCHRNAPKTKDKAMHNLQPQRNSKFPFYCGILSPVIAFFLISLAILVSPWWTWTENALSDLGVDGVNAVLFNSGLILGAILYFIFSLGGLKQFFQNQAIGRIGVFFLMLVAVFMFLIGVFPEQTPYHLHVIVSVGFFVTLVLSLLILAIAMLRIPSERKLGVFTMLLAIIALLPWVVPNPWKGVAIPELIAAVAGAIWSITMSLKLLTKREPN